MKNLEQAIKDLHAQDMSPDSELFGDVEIRDTETTKDDAEKIFIERYKFMSQFGEEIDIDSPEFDRSKMEEFEKENKKLSYAYMANGKYYKR